MGYPDHRGESFMSKDRAKFEKNLISKTLKNFYIKTLK